jgi:transaldolase
MGASFRNAGQIEALAGCDRVTAFSSTRMPWRTKNEGIQLFAKDLRALRALVGGILARAA